MEKILHQTYRKVEKTHWWFMVRRRIVYDLLDKFSVIPNKHKILDVGCNNGFFVSILQKRGFNVYGSDVLSEAIDFGKRQGIENLFIASGENQPFDDNFFDAVLCLDVLEHIEDDTKAFNEIIRVLKPGGTLIVMVPAFPFLWGLQDEVAEHFRRYTRKTLIQLFNHSGLSIVRMSYFNFFLFAPIALIRLFQKLKKPKRSSDLELNNSFSNAVFKFVFLTEAKLLRFINFPFGVSLLAVLKKKQ